MTVSFSARAAVTIVISLSKPAKVKLAPAVTPVTELTSTASSESSFVRVSAPFSSTVNSATGANAGVKTTVRSVIASVNAITPLVSSVVNMIFTKLIFSDARL